ncbi:MAG: DUF308 domain-containing protein [Lachnospiraceae bacterium]|nr:DUF308 domain-containing protein [Lachnospiraceae bacterium]
MRKILVIILGILLVCLAGFLLVRPITAFSTMGYVMGFALLINGIANIIIWFKLKKIAKPSIWFLISTILSVIIALCIFGDVYFKLAFETVLVYIVAIWFIVTGFIRIKHSFDMKATYDVTKDESNKMWWLMLIIGVLVLLCGLMSIMNPFVLMLAIGLNIAINMMICGIDLLTLGVMF